MGDDLGKPAGEVHAAAPAAAPDVGATAAAVLAFWFDELDEKRRFAKDADLDARIARDFGAAQRAVLAGGAVGWTDAPDMLLAAIILLDQFSRNLHRGSAEAFAGDPLALALARLAIARGWARDMDTLRRQFLYMPFMHSEDGHVQEESVALYEALGDDHILGFATGHRDLIRRFGRYPHRNAALSRASTPEEEAYLSQPGAGY